MSEYQESCFSKAHGALRKTIHETPGGEYTDEVYDFVKRLINNLRALSEYG